MREKFQSDFIHRYEVSPSANADGRTLLLLHGTGGDESDLLPIGRTLDSTAALLSVRGRVLENGVPRFFRRLAEGVFDEEDIVRRADELAEFLEAAASHYSFPLRSMIAVGYSNGANIAAAMLLLGRAKFRGAILLRAMVPLVPPVVSRLEGTRVLIASGMRDPIVPVENAERLGALLKAAGADAEIHWSDAGHTLIPADLDFTRRWLHAGR
jgi:phospholipase/carboxylesterase